MDSSRRRLAAALAAGCLLPSLARAQKKWPPRPVRIVVPFGPGGIADLTARAVGQALSQQLGQAVIVDNRPGAGGVVGGELVARAEPDGTTLLLLSNGSAVTAALFRKLPFDIQKDFAPVALLGMFELGLVVPANSRFRSAADFIAAAHAQPGKLNLATIAVGSTQNLAAELFRSTGGLKLQVVPFNGTPAVVTALRGGEVDAAIEILGPLQPQVAAGALRVLAVLGDSRSPALPKVPRLGELGGPFAGFAVNSWNALAAPARTPPDVVDRLSRALQAALAQPQLQQQLAALDVVAGYQPPPVLAELLARDLRRWNSVIDHAGIARQ
ncbi:MULTISPECIES: tripartite tricarboxylate transporter substrate-binding protein [Ramlibacter]|uniref:Tripartite tricarboxylate transporter substrate binding protein n=1 Tax=Ramlibacter aquaticus TaxID=2780094 RepID=A0ABR9SI60_9BURK|nr:MULTISPECIES: tripartite tricarboxylate transporter substrate-binding protein [Ramlibacter]MBE7941584.1 tripartite tricarboxylate transporter substrate binding protein [Ramlibacter aquaticus]